jgi:hypothetical protein
MKLTEDQIRRIARQEASKSTRSGGGVGGGISASWVEENYISKAFFNRIFEIYGPGEHSGDPDVQVEPNDTDTTISNIKALVGFWAEEYLSALGQNSEQGGGGISLNEPLASINNASLGIPSNGQTLVYRNNQWTYGTSGGSGSVTSITAGTGLSGGTITTSGTIAIDSTYQTYISHGESAYNALSNYLLKSEGVTAIVVGTGTNADKIGVTINGSNTGFITVPYSSKAAQLSTARTIWGQSFDGSAAVKGDITQATCLEFSEIGGSAGHGGYIDFHYNGSTSDYTSRIIEDASGVLKINNAIFAKLSGNVSIGTSTISQTYKLDVNGYTKTSRLYLTDSVYFEYDSSNSGVRLINAGFYADTYVSALGSNSGGGGGSGDYIPLSGSTAITGNLTPSSNNSVNLGAESKRWSSVYCTNLRAYGGSIAGNLTMAGNITPTANQQYGLGTSSLMFSSLHVLNSYTYGTLSVNHFTLFEDTYSPAQGVTYSQSHLKSTLNVMYLECVSGIQSSNTISTRSDIRLKTIQRYIDYLSVDAVASAPIFDYTWNEKPNGNVFVGTSAQYWQSVLPNAVSPMFDRFLSLDYSATALVSTVITARKVVDHEARIRLLEVENQALRNEINILKKMV